jgi:hypothetical protein
MNTKFCVIDCFYWLSDSLSGEELLVFWMSALWLLDRTVVNSAGV